MEQTLGKRIAKNRKRMGLTQDQLAEQMGVTPQAVSKWENDQSCPDITALPRLAEIFGITTDELLGREPVREVHEAEVVNEPEEDDSREEEGLRFQKGDWEFRWDGGKKNGICFSLWVLSVGILYFCTKWFQWDTNLWNILWPSALVFFGLFGVFPRFSFFRLGCAVFGGYFLIDHLGILDLSIGGELIIPVILILWGLSLLVDTLRKKHKKGIQVYRNGKKLDSHDKKNTFSSFTNSGDSFHCEGSFCDERHCVKLPLLKSGHAEISFGQMNLDLSEVETVAEECSIHAECSFGQLTLLVPRKFRVNVAKEAVFGSVNQRGEPDTNYTGEIQLHAEASFGEICVVYI